MGYETHPNNDRKVFLKIGTTLQGQYEEKITTILKDNVRSFAWVIVDLPDTHPSIACHTLSTFKDARTMVQKKRKLRKEKRKVAKVDVEKLLQGGFIQEARYTTIAAQRVQRFV